MNALFVALSAAGYASAQYVNGYSMVSMPSDGSYYGSSAPPQYTGAASSTYGGSVSQYTPPPSQSSFYEVMPYESMTAGGYSSLECGYGYYKASNGYCMQESWVSFHWPSIIASRGV